MLFLGIGILALTLKYLEIGPFAGDKISWLICLIPFGLAVLWWWWADASGYTKRKAVEKENNKKAARIEKSRAAMGMLPKNKR